MAQKLIKLMAQNERWVQSYMKYIWPGYTVLWNTPTDILEVTVLERISETLSKRFMTANNVKFVDRAYL